MIPTLQELALAVGTSFAASIVTKVTIVLAVGLVGARFSRRNRASARHFVLAATFAVLLLLPITSLITPTVRIAVPAVGQAGEDSLPETGRANSNPPISVTSTSAAPSPVDMRRSKVSLPALLTIVWMIGMALCLAPMVAGLWKMHSFRRSGIPWEEGQQLAERLALDIGFRRQVEVLLHESLAGPVTFGILRPVVLLPPDVTTWKKDDLERALVHELEHVRRADGISNWLAGGACAVYWFHPLVWIAWRQLALEAERSCDDAVLVQSEPVEYADQLVALARKLSVATKPLALAMANRADLAIRVRAVLDRRQQRGRVGPLVAAAGCMVAAVVVFAMSPLRTISAPESSSAQVSGPFALRAGESLPEFKSVSIKRSHREESHRGVTQDGLTLVDLPPEEMIEIAYGIDFGDFGYGDFKNQRLLGGPSWARNWLGPAGLNYEGYNILASVDDSVAKGFGEDNNGHLFWSGRCPYRREMMLMFQSLLADRFQLKIRREAREVPIYALVVAPSGPRFLHTTVTLPPPPCMEGTRCFQGYVSMARLADRFEGSLDRPVVDQTGLQGGYYVKLEWPRKPNLDGTHIAPGFGSTAFMFSAFEQQLGLQLVPTEGPVDFLVIDHIERPSEN